MLGLDIGGSTSRARLRGGGSADQDFDGPGANVATLAVDLAEERLARLLSSVGPKHPVACCAGAAGAEVPDARARLESLLHRMLPDSRICVVHDARLVLAAAGVDSGIALIAGTGSVAYGRTFDGREAQRGGWGWMLGDEGSAVAITREAARLLMARNETGDRLGALGAKLLQASGSKDAYQLNLKLHAMHEPAAWAALASAVFEAVESDLAADGIVRYAGAALARRVMDVREALRIKDPVVLAGGLLLNQPRLEAVVRERLPNTHFVRLEAPPVEGAVRLAQELLRA